MESFLSLTGAAAQLGISERTLLRRGRAGDIQLIKIGKQIRVSESELERFMTHGSAEEEKDLITKQLKINMKEAGI